MKLLIAMMLMAALPASAAVICAGCEYDDASEATYLGEFDANARDGATFQHTGVSEDAFTDYWVFDIAPTASGSVSADYTTNAAIEGFAALLRSVDGGTCVEKACSGIVAGDVIAEAVAGVQRWELFVEALAPGRYVLEVTGDGNPRNGGAYGGQMGFAAITIDEPSTLPLVLTVVAAVVIVGLIVLVVRARS